MLPLLQERATAQRNMSFTALVFFNGWFTTSRTRSLLISALALFSLTPPLSCHFLWLALHVIGHGSLLSHQDKHKRWMQRIASPSTAIRPALPSHSPPFWSTLQHLSFLVTATTRLTCISWEMRATMRSAKAFARSASSVLAASVWMTKRPISATLARSYCTSDAMRR